MHPINRGYQKNVNEEAIRKLLLNSELLHLMNYISTAFLGSYVNQKSKLLLDIPKYPKIEKEKN